MLDLGYEDSGMPGRQDVGLGDAGTWDSGTPGHGMQGREKQRTPEFCAEFAIYSFQWVRERYYVMEGLSADQ